MYFSVNYSAASGGEHSNDEDVLKSQCSPVDGGAGNMEGYGQYESAHYAVKGCSSLENSDDRSYESDSSVNDTNVDNEEQIDERKPAATAKKLSTKRGKTLEHKEQLYGRKPVAKAKKLFTNRGGTIEYKEEYIPSRNRVVKPSSG